MSEEMPSLPVADLHYSRRRDSPLPARREISVAVAAISSTAVRHW